MFNLEEKLYLEMEMKIKLDKLKKSLGNYTNQATNKFVNLELTISDLRKEITLVENIIKKLEGDGND